MTHSPSGGLSPAALKEIDTCVHCGLCLPSCPTYQELGQEPDSPRGRIYLVKAAQEGRIAPDSPALLSHLDLCLGCLNCQTVCPSGVGYGVILEEARELTESARRRPPLTRWLRGILLRRILPHPGRLFWLTRLSGWACRLGLHRLGAALRLVPAHLAQMADVTPFGAGAPARRRLPAEWAPDRPAAAPGSAAAQLQPGPRVALVLGCVQDVLFPDTNVATARVLVRHGCTVLVPPEQTCCGALHAHAGDGDEARRLARRNIEAFAASGAAYIVINAAGCGAHLKRYGELLRDDPAYAERAAAFSRRVRDFTELVAALQAEGSVPAPSDGESEPVPATYQDPCHMSHGQGIRREPRVVLGGLSGLALAEMADETCCGSAGFYNLVQPEISMRVLDRKMEKVRQTGARLVITANPGCLMQLRLGARRAGLAVEVRHIADVLDQAYGGGERHG